jgi:translation initiation factor 1
MAKNKSGAMGIVYSTDSSFKFEEELAETITTSPSMQKLKVKLETKQRAGKAVTLIQGFIGTVTDAEDLGKKLKSFCGTGGSVKNGEIIVQGDNREKLLGWLIKNGYVLTKKIG